MFDNERFMTKGIQDNISLELQLFMWSCIDTLKWKEKEIDSLQAFELSLEKKNGIIFQNLEHRQEVLKYKRLYKIPSKEAITEKIFVIDDGLHSTMMLRSEY
ncbi:MAG: hypothetical protein K0Q49_2298 [Haloplasmataceae bacterium]|jgi:hypothetical protein|nr:hypothetical protein [Haloplasmataceae bacterium]